MAAGNDKDVPIGDKATNDDDSDFESGRSHDSDAPVAGADAGAAKEAKVVEEVEKWLENDVKLPQYKTNFGDHGYEKMTDIINLTKDDLKSVLAIDKPGHVCRIFDAIQVHKKEDDIREHEAKVERFQDEHASTTIKVWLHTKVNLPDKESNTFAGLFADHGYADLMSLEDITEDDIKNVDIEQKGYQKRIVSESKKLFPNKREKIEVPKIEDAATAVATINNDLKLDETDHGIKFENDTKFGGSGQGAVHFCDLNDHQRRKLIENTKLLYGRSCTADGVESKTWPIFELKKGYQHLHRHFTMETKSSFVSMTKYDAHQVNLAVHGYANTSVAASVGGGGFGVSAEVSGSASTATAKEKIHKTNKEWATDIAKGLYPRGTIELDSRCLVLTDQFKKDYKQFLHNSTNSFDAKERRKFRDKYGWWVDLKVHVGGKIYSTQERELKSDEDQKQKSKAFEAKVSSKVSSPWVSGAMEASHGKGGDTSNLTEHVQSMSSIRINSIGGESTAVSQSDWSKWQESVASNYSTWAVINISKTCDVESLFSLMDDKAMPEQKKPWSYNVVCNFDARTLRHAGWKQVMHVSGENKDPDGCAWIHPLTVVRNQLVGARANPKIFVGAANAENGDHILLGAFAVASVLVPRTSQRIPETAAIPPTFAGSDYGVYWYFTTTAFGFAPSPTIKLKEGYGDTHEDGTDKQRLSWAGPKMLFDSEHSPSMLFEAGINRAGINRNGKTFNLVIWIEPMAEED